MPRLVKIPKKVFRDGDQVIVKMFIKSPGGRTRDLQVMPHHIIDLQVKQFLGGAAKAVIRLYDETFDSLEDVIFNSGVLDTNPSRSSGQPVFRLQFGWATGENLGPPFELRVHNYTNKFTLGKGAELELNCTGAGSVQAIFNRGNLYFPKNSAVSTVVQRIANDNDLLSDVEEGTIPISIRQNGRNALRWLHTIASTGNMIAGSGNRNYNVWVDSSTTPKPTLVVRCRSAPAPTTTQWNYLYGRDSQGEVKDWEVQLQTAQLFSLGASSFKTSIINKGDKSGRNIIVNNRTLTGVASEGLFVPEPSNTPAPLRLAFENTDEALAYCADKFHRLNTTNNVGRLTILGNPNIKPGDLITIVVPIGTDGITDIRDVHPTSGRYTVRSIEHNITLGDYTTVVDCTRNGTLLSGVGGTVRNQGTPAATRAVQQSALAETQAVNALAVRKLSVFGG
jgi:hypothetical protein